MRIRGKNLSPAAAEADRHISVSSPQSQSQSQSPSPSPSSSPSSSSSSSSITAAHSSLASSQDSSTSFPFSLLDTTTHRCRGLDLLVKAIHQVTAGSVIGVPYIQRRVTIRRRRRITPGFPFDGVVLTEMFGQSKAQQQNGKKLKNKQRKGKNSARQRTAIGFSF